MKHRHFQIIGLLLLLFNCSGIQAQINSDTLIINEIIIASSRALQTDPVSIQNIQLDEIESIYSGQDPAVLVEQLSPSIISYSDAGTDIGNYAQFRMRGISQDRINITLNGVPLNDMADQGTFFSNFSDFGNSIESIQVQRGVGASKAGVASYGGAVNFESFNPFRSQSHSELQLTTGSFGTLRLSGELSTGLQENNTGVYGRFTRTITGGYKDHSGSDSYSYFLSGGILGEKDVLKITAFAGKTENDQSYLPVLLSDIEVNPKTNYNHPNDTDNFEQEMIQIQYGRQSNTNRSSNFTLYYGGARGVFPFGLDNSTQLVFGLNNRRYGLMGNWNFKNTNWDITNGFHGYLFSRSNEDYTAPNIVQPTYRDQTNKNAISTFSKIRLSNNRFTFYSDLQLRYIDFSFSADIGGINHNRDWTFFNWLGGISYALNSESSIYSSIGQTSREPTRSDIFQGSEQDIRSNNLSQESVVNIEFGWRYSSPTVQLNANFFYMDFNNEIVRTGALQENSYMDITQNVPNSQRFGFEIQSKIQIINSTDLLINIAQLNSNIDNFNSGSEDFIDVEHIFMPDININTRLSHTFSDKVNLSLISRYVSRSFIELSNDPEFILPSYFVLSSQLNYQITKACHFSFFLNNLTNTRYFNDGAVVDNNFDGIADGPGFRIQPPRHIYLMIGLRF